MDRNPDRGDEVYSITSARQAHTTDISHRERNYAISMGIRTLCFIGGVIAWFHIMWLGVVLFIGALVLPYTSVILANAGVRKAGDGVNLANMASGALESGDGDAGTGTDQSNESPEKDGPEANRADDEQ